LRTALLLLLISDALASEQHEVAECPGAAALMQHTDAHRIQPVVANNDAKLMSEVESLGFISEPDEVWLKRKHIHMGQMRNEASHRHDCDNCKRGAEWFQIHYEPSFHCEFEERIGSMGDGGKWVCDPGRIASLVNSGQRCLIYSVGCNGDFSFEQSVLQRISPSCEIHTFDPAKEGTWKVPENVNYHAVALGQTAPARPLASLVKELGHVGQRIDLFKIDCEGCEWDTYEAWLGSGVNIGQILVEMHWQQNPETVHRMFDFLTKNGYVVFNKEPNTFGCGGECIEYSFLKLDPTFHQEV